MTFDRPWLPSGKALDFAPASRSHLLAHVVQTVSPMRSEPTLADETRVGQWTRRLKVAALGAARLYQWASQPADFGAPVHASGRFPHLLYGARIPLERSDAHPVFEQGKRHNVRLAAPSFDGLELTPERPFSFWRALGRVTEERGYRHGMELAGGCIVPAIGGGLCLLSRALFQLAVYSGFDILERHGHSLVAVEPPPGVLWGLDATVLWPYVDLRFAPRQGRVALKVHVQDGALHVSARSTLPKEGRVELAAVDERVKDRVRHNRIVRRVDGEFRDVVAVNTSRLITEEHARRSCLTCNETACHSRVIPDELPLPSRGEGRGEGRERKNPRVASHREQSADEPSRKRAAAFDSPRALAPHPVPLPATGEGTRS